MADDNTTPIRTDVPSSLHGAVIKGDGNGPTQARTVMNQMYSVQGQVIDLRAMTESKGPKAPGQAATPARVPAGQAAQAAIPVVERAVNQADTAIANLGTQIEALDKQIAGALMSGKADPASMAEIRSYWLAQGRGKESAFLKVGERFQSPAENMRTVSAILDAPGYLSGIDDPSNMAALPAPSFARVSTTTDSRTQRGCRPGRRGRARRRYQAPTGHPARLIIGRE